MKTVNEKYIDSVAAVMFARLKQESMVRKIPMVFINKNTLIDLIKSQSFKCARTGMLLTLNRAKVERLDSDLPFTTDNIRLVNKMKEMSNV